MVENKKKIENYLYIEKVTAIALLQSMFKKNSKIQIGHAVKHTIFLLCFYSFAIFFLFSSLSVSISFIFLIYTH
jgi:hypothetical protein